MENSKFNCDIFLCYRGTDTLLAKNFKIYADSISQSLDDRREFGKIWYSDFEASGKLDDEEQLKSLIFSAKYFIIFFFKGFTEDFFLDEEMTILNPDCITANELYYAALAEQENNLEIIVVNMDFTSFDADDIKRDMLRLEKFFEIKKIGKSNPVSIITSKNRNYHISRQDDDKKLYERLLNAFSPIIDKETILFGSYPQELIKDQLLYVTLIEMVGGIPKKEDFGNWKSYQYYYDGVRSDYVLYVDVCYQNEKYRGIFFFELRPVLTISKKSYLSRIGCQTNKVYWFKYKPIEWEVVITNDTRMGLVSKLVLDSQPINYTVDDINGVNANNYEFSVVRKWLNYDFYNTAFNDSEKKLICDSSPIVSCSCNSELKDYVFLLSEMEVCEYYPKVKNRCKISTHYAKYQGVYITKYPDWFLRTPSQDTDTDNLFVDGYTGEIEEDLVIYTNGGIVPAIMIKK